MAMWIVNTKTARTYLVSWHELPWFGVCRPNRVAESKEAREAGRSGKGKINRSETSWHFRGRGFLLFKRPCPRSERSHGNWGWKQEKMARRKERGDKAGGWMRGVLLSRGESQGRGYFKSRNFEPKKAGTIPWPSLFPRPASRVARAQGEPRPPGFFSVARLVNFIPSLLFHATLPCE